MISVGMQSVEYVRIFVSPAIKSKIKDNHFWLYEFYKHMRYFFRTFYLWPILRKMQPARSVSIIKLGSEHGWALGDRSYLIGSIAISAGLGQDASFDIEYIGRYRARVFLIDPTPSAIDHFQEISLRFGTSKEREYVRGGVQPINSYDLSLVNDNNLRLISKALFNSNREIRFFEPKNGATSYSALNIFKTDNSISVQAITFSELLKDLQIKSNEVFLVKLDIEGAASEVLFDFLGKPCLPHQILVEFEEVFVFSIANAKKLVRTFRLLQAHNYRLIYTDKVANFTFELMITE